MKKLNQSLLSLEVIIALTVLFSMIALSIAEFLIRLLSPEGGLPYSTVITEQLITLLTFVGMIITAANGEHLCAALLPHVLSGKAKNNINRFANVFSAVYCFAFAWTALYYTTFAFSLGTEAGISDNLKKIITYVIFLSFISVGCRFIVRQNISDRQKWLSIVIALVLGTWLAAPSVLIFLYGWEPPPIVSGVVEVWVSFFQTLKWPLLLLTVFSTFAGLPIFIVLGGAAYLLLPLSILDFGIDAVSIAGSQSLIIEGTHGLVVGSSIIAIPFFCFSGYIMSRSQAGVRLVRFFKALFGFLPGGTVFVVILVCAFFTALTGASGVTILALGGLLFAILKKSGPYSDNFLIGLLASVGSIGILFPPSLPIIVFGSTSSVSILDLFIAGLIPGLLLVLSMAVLGFIESKKRRVAKIPFESKEAISAVRASIWEILLPIWLVGGYFNGFFSITEASALMAIYVCVIGLFVNRDITLDDIGKAAKSSVIIVGGILIILGMAQGLSAFFVDQMIPQQLAAWCQENIGSRYVFLLFLNLGLLIAGCFMDIYSAILLLEPLVTPLSQIYDINTVHLGVIFLANLELGFLTPPVGLNLFLASYCFKTSLFSVYRAVLPFLVVQLIVVLIITYAPELSLALVSIFGGSSP